jgi:amino acid adenylation domain-containing protein
MPGNPVIQRLMTFTGEELRRVLFAASAGRLSYGEVRERMLAYAGWLSTFEGVCPGDRVAICLPKTPETAQLIYGILATGAAYVPLEYRGAPARLNRILASIRPALFVTTGPMAALLHQAGEPAPTGMRLIETDEDTAALAGRCRGIPPARAVADVSPAELSAIFFTSGSTGDPKGVMWSQRGLEAAVADTVRRRGARPDDRFISVAQLHYSASCEIFYPVMTGASVYLCNDREMIFADRLAELVEGEATTIWGSTSTALRLFLEEGSLPARNLHALRVVEFFGERMPVAALRQAMSAMPNANFHCVYGATEAFNIAEYILPRPLPPDMDRLPLGRPYESYDFSLRDEAGAEVMPGETGEICIAGAGVTMGYWNASPGNEVRRLAGRADSFCTGDLARLDEGGLYDFAGRQDQMIKIRGHRFELGEAESAAKSDPRVRDAVAFPIGSPAQATGVILAVLTEVDGEQADIEGALRRINLQRLPRYAQPRRIVVCRKFPLLSSGKVDRRALQLRIAESGE